MFSKKNKETARKVKVQHDEQPEQEIKINRVPDNTCGVAKLVSIEQHQLTVNGRKQAPEYRISIGGRDVLMVNSREYKELTREILRHISPDALVHEISVIHAEEHAAEEAEMHDVEELFNGLESAIKNALPRQ